MTRTCSWRWRTPRTSRLRRSMAAVSDTQITVAERTSIPGRWDEVWAVNRGASDSRDADACRGPRKEHRNGFSGRWARVLLSMLLGRRVFERGLADGVVVHLPLAALALELALGRMEVRVDPLGESGSESRLRSELLDAGLANALE